MHWRTMPWTMMGALWHLWQQRQRRDNMDDGSCKVRQHHPSNNDQQWTRIWMQQRWMTTVVAAKVDNDDEGGRWQCVDKDVAVVDDDGGDGRGGGLWQRWWMMMMTVDGDDNNKWLECPMTMKRGQTKVSMGLMPLFVLAAKLKTLIGMSACCLYSFISAGMAVLSSFWHHHDHYASRMADFMLITQ